MGEISKSSTTQSAAVTEKLVQKTLAKAINSQHYVAVKNVERLRRVHPDKSPVELIRYMDKMYISAVSATGAAAGAAAAVPNLVVQIPAAVADLTSYLELSVLYALSVAEAHGLHAEDYERRALLVTAVLLGNSVSTQLVEKAIGRTAPHLGRVIVTAIPQEALKAINKVIGRNFVTKFGTKAGVLVLGKQVPLFIGAAIGGVGNSMFGMFVVKSARKSFGEPPKTWPTESAPKTAATKSVKVAKPKTTAK